MVPISLDQSQFLEAPLVRQADGELKKNKVSSLFLIWPLLKRLGQKSLQIFKKIQNKKCQKSNASPFKFGAGFALGHLTSSLLSCFLSSSISKRSLLFSFSSILSLLRGSAEAKNKQTKIYIKAMMEK